MMMVRRLFICLASAAVHLTAIGGALLIAGVGADSAMFVDLVADAGGEARPDARPRAQARSLPARPARVPDAPAPRLASVVKPDRADAPSPPMTLVPNVEEPPALAATSNVGDAGRKESPRESAQTVALNETAPTPAAAPKAGAAREDGEGSAAHLVEGVNGLRASGTRPPGVGSGSTVRTGPVNTSTADGTPASMAISGDGHGGIPPEYGPYLARFRRRVQESATYPLAARRRGLSGSVELEVLLEASGRIAAVTVVGSSSHALLDEAALDTVKRLAPEPIPEPLPRRPLRIRLPLAFELQ